MNDTAPLIASHGEHYSRRPHTESDLTARFIARTLAAVMDFFFQERYCHRAVVLETIAAVPGMVGGLLQHLKSLRFIRDDEGRIQTLLDEAENERMHLIIYSKLAEPTSLERIFIMIVQFFFYHLYFLLYLCTPRTAHRVVGYFEEEAIKSYEHYLKLVQDGIHDNVKAPELATEYWKLGSEARLTDMIKATIIDEMNHRDVNHAFASDPEIKIWS